MDSRVNLLESLKCSYCFLGTTFKAVLKIEQWLADRVGEGDRAIIDESNPSNAPALVATNLSLCSKCEEEEIV